MSTKYKLPICGKIRLTSPYGKRVLDGQEETHYGIDLVGVEDKIIRAPAAGWIGSSKIIMDHSNATWEWGNYVRIDQEDAEISIYLCHLSKRLVELGEYVKAGDAIGVEGATGYAFGSHVHLEFRQIGKPFNPCPLLGIPNKTGELNGDPLPPWYQDAVTWARRKGILKGVSEDELALEMPCTRAQLVTMLWRYWQLGR